MPGGLTLLQSLDADIPTPAASKITVYFSSNLGLPAYKDSSGVVHSLVGVTGAQGQTGPVILQDDSGGGGGSDLSAPGGASTPPELLANIQYRPGSDTALSTTSATLADVDAANLIITFTVPPSGNILVRLTAHADINVAGQKYQWSLREGSSNIANAGGVVQRATNGSCVTTAFRITGLTPGTVTTYKWSHAADQAAACTGRIVVGAGALGFPAATMEIWSA
jgi:hypothetical protein